MSISGASHSDKYRVLRNVFGFDSFRGDQEAVVDTLLAGTSVLAIMPTGAGKSLCYQVPALVTNGLTIVVSPLVSLMQDQIAALTLADVAAAAINSSQDRQTNVEVWQRVMSGKIRLLYMAPERLMTERMLAALSKLPLSLIAIDEAHCMSQWGPSFRPEYAALSRLPEHFPGIPIAAMTATADEATRRDIEIQLFRGNSKTFVSGFDRPNITLGVTSKRNWKHQLLSFLKQYEGQSGIVYCLSRKKTEETAELLTSEGYNTLPYHAGLTPEQRLDHQNRFLTEPSMIITATVAFGMGIDKPDVRFVFHADLPASMEAYYQEIGRAGRDGEPAEAMMIFGANDIRMRRQFIEQENSDDARKIQEHKRFDALMAFCEAVTCRRQTLLAYFGEQSEPCGNCDLCIDPVALEDGTELALLVTGAIIETGERFGQAHIIEVLRGADTEKVRKFRHDRIDSHGLGSSLKHNQWLSIIRQMVASGFLEIDVAGYGALHITQKGGDLTRGRERFSYRPEIADPIVETSKKSRRDKPLTTPQLLSEQDGQLLTALKRKRLELAKGRNVPAYVIFPDKTLQEMAHERPGTLAEMAAIKGIGEKKLKTLGQAFLDVILDS